MAIDKEGKDLNLHLGNKKLFIETGTEYGNGYESAIQAGFTDIHSIEIDEKFVRWNEKYLKAVPPPEGVTISIEWGDSLEKLPNRLKSTEESFLLFLDAHWSAEGYMGENMQTFLPKELKMIYDFRDKFTDEFKDSVIIIDDINHFLPDPRQDLMEQSMKRNFCDEVYRLLREINPHFHILLFDSKSGNGNKYLLASESEEYRNYKQNHPAT